jgi:hypothetical protein
MSEQECTDLVLDLPDGTHIEEHNGVRMTTKKSQFADISKQLEIIRKQKQELKVTSAFSKVKGDAPKVDYSKRPKKLFNHPKLDYIYGEIVYSPYMCSPIEHYPAETFTVHKKLQELRANELIADGADLKLPYDLRKTKNAFIRIVNYKPHYGVSI